MYSDENPKVITWVCDARFGSEIYERGSQVDSEGRLIDPPVLVYRSPEYPVPLPPEPRTPSLAHTFEFGLSGSETQEQSLPLSEGSVWKPDAVVAIQSVRAFLTRDGEPVPAASPINGVEVDAELRPGGIFCTAKLSDFGPADLVVARVEVALY